MRAVLYMIKDRHEEAVVDPICFYSMEMEDLMPSFQISQLLNLLKKKHKCIEFEEKPTYMDESKAIEAIYDCGADEDLEDDIDWKREIQYYLNRKTYLVTPLDNFSKVFDKYINEAEAAFRLHLEAMGGEAPVLYVNEIPIRKFQNSSYAYRIMKLALDLPNKSVVPVKMVLKDNRSDRGCSQDLADIFKCSALKLAFTANIKKESFIINHTVTEADLSENEAFQELVRKNSGLSNTTYLTEEIRKCKILL